MCELRVGAEQMRPLVYILINGTTPGSYQPEICSILLKSDFSPGSGRRTKTERLLSDCAGSLVSLHHIFETAEFKFQIFHAGSHKSQVPRVGCFFHL